MITDVYIGMNGVLTDFDSYYATCAPNDPDQNHRWYEVITHVRIYDRLDIIPGSYELIKYCQVQPFQTHILTSSETAVPKLMMETRLQRNRWLLKHGIPFKAIFTMNQFEKANYAKDTSVLISTNRNALSAFQMKGGKAIYHSTVEDTIKQLHLLTQNA